MTDDISGSRLFEYVPYPNSTPNLIVFFFKSSQSEFEPNSTFSSPTHHYIHTYYLGKLKYISQGHMHIYILRYLPLKRAMHCKK